VRGTYAADADPAVVGWTQLALVAKVVGEHRGLYAFGDTVCSGYLSRPKVPASRGWMSQHSLRVEHRVLSLRQVRTKVLPQASGFGALCRDGERLQQVFVPKKTGAL
jgi:hypothetical protein